MSEKVRVLRVLEYVGDREWVENTLANSGVPLNGVSPVWSKSGGHVKSGMIGAFPEVLQEVIHPVTKIKEMIKNKIANADNHYEQDLYQDILKYIEEEVE